MVQHFLQLSIRERKKPRLRRSRKIDEQISESGVKKRHAEPGEPNSGRKAFLAFAMVTIKFADWGAKNGAAGEDSRGLHYIWYAGKFGESHYS